MVDLKDIAKGATKDVAPTEPWEEENFDEIMNSAKADLDEIANELKAFDNELARVQFFKFVENEPVIAKLLEPVELKSQFGVGKGWKCAVRVCDLKVPVKEYIIALNASSIKKQFEKLDLNVGNVVKIVYSGKKANPVAGQPDFNSFFVKLLK